MTISNHDAEDASVENATTEDNASSWHDRGGYAELSWFMNSSPDQNFNLIRRFGRLNTRCILYLQDELTEMEAALDEMDKEYGSVTRRYDQHPDRPALINLVQDKIQTYNNLVLQRAEMQKLSSASSFQTRSWGFWIDGTRPVHPEELVSLQHPDDMVTLGGPERDWLYKKIERMYWPIFASEKERNIAPNHPSIKYTSHTRLRRATKAIVLLGTLVFILCPILALAHVDNKRDQLIIVCGSISGFGLLVTIMTKARTFEISAAIAAYAAVVVVFLGATP
ncbi:hypothetical protein QBC35DRAFT_454390 [Podospora australis]|uniref:DUF6594 domain-containing protein n=1 Tax=Podospora australis TaxID=1536484 RepID=A0AAN7AFG6_9PEZI|nr:hypothetical protein QBC35DRAFT_454390 [Podospora australis]